MCHKLWHIRESIEKISARKMPKIEKGLDTYPNHQKISWSWAWLLGILALCYPTGRGHGLGDGPREYCNYPMRRWGE